MKKAFSLVEFLVVLAVGAIILAIAIPSISQISQRSSGHPTTRMETISTEFTSAGILIVVRDRLTGDEYLVNPNGGMTKLSKKKIEDDK